MIAIFALVFTKVVGLFGGGALQALLATWTNKEVQRTKRFAIFGDAIVAATNAQLEARKVVAQERQALWYSPLFRFMTALIVLPAAAHAAGIYIDSLFNWFWLPWVGWVRVFWAIPPAPEPYATMQNVILISFITGGSFVGGVVGAAKAFRKV